MKFKEYKKQKFKKKAITSHILKLATTITISLLFFILMLNTTMTYFDARIDATSVKLSKIATDEAKKQISQMSELDEMRSQLSELGDDLCIHKDRLVESEIQPVLERECVNKTVSAEELTNFLIDDKVQEIETTAKLEISNQLHTLLFNAQTKFNNLINKSFILKPPVLSLILLILLICNFALFGTILTLDVIGKKLIFVLTPLLVMPYLFSKYGLFDFLITKSIPRLVKGEASQFLTIDLITRISQVISYEIGRFYNQFLLTALIIFLSGVVIFVISRLLFKKENHYLSLH